MNLDESILVYATASHRSTAVRQCQREAKKWFAMTGTHEFVQCRPEVKHVPYGNRYIWKVRIKFLPLPAFLQNGGKTA